MCPIPADAKAVIVAQNLVAARYVQLTPSYREGGGPKMGDGGVIPMRPYRRSCRVGRGQDPIDAPVNGIWGRRAGVSGTSISRFVDSAANALDGNGEKLRETLTQLSSVSRIFAEGSGNIVDIIKNLQIFVTALRDSKEQIVLFQNRLATVSAVSWTTAGPISTRRCPICPSRSGEVQRFVAGSRNQTSEQIQRLGSLTQVLVDNRLALENVLHITPNAIANFENIYYPNGGSVTGAFSVSNFSNPVWFVCGMIGGVANTTAPETAKLCAQYLGPALRLLNVNEPAVSDQRLPAARGQSGSAHLHRSEARARRCRAR